MNYDQKTSIEINAELKALYKKWPEMKRFLKSIGCKRTDAEDIFQEALVLFARKVEEPDFELTVAPFHYVKGICRFIWYNQSRKEGKNPSVELHDNFSFENDEWYEQEMRLKKVETALSKIGKKCQELLQMFYNRGLNMIEIAKKLDLRNDKVAKAQKYRCLNKVKEIVQAEH